MGPIGLFGGTFDPIHLGHLRTALELKQDLGLAEIRFTPCGLPPHGKEPAAPAALRRDMIAAAIDGQPGFTLDDRELTKTAPAYTVESLEALRQELPGQPLAFIVGMDAFGDIDTWHRYAELIGLAHIVVVSRPGAALPDAGYAAELLAAHAAADAAALAATPAGCVVVQPVTPLDISSSAIRTLMRRNASPRFLVPDAVARIIATSGCYAA